MISSSHVVGPFLQASSSLLALAAAPAVRSILVACAAALVLGALRVKSVAPRLAVWKIVLCCALAMPVLGWLFPVLPFSIPAPKFAGKSVFGMVELASSPAASVPHAMIEPKSRTSAAVASGTDLNLAPAVAEPPGPSSARTSKPVRAESLYTRLKGVAGAEAYQLALALDTTGFIDDMTTVAGMAQNRGQVVYAAAVNGVTDVYVYLANF